MGYDQKKEKAVGVISIIVYSSKKLYFLYTSFIRHIITELLQMKYKKNHVTKYTIFFINV